MNTSINNFMNGYMTHKRGRMIAHKLLNEFFRDDILGTPLNHDYRTRTNPLMNIKKDENNYEIELAIPGLSKDEIKIEVTDNILNVSTHKIDQEVEDNSSDDKKNSYFIKRFDYKNFSRKFELPEYIDTENISVKYENGVLDINIPKLKEEDVKVSKVIEIS